MIDYCRAKDALYGYVKVSVRSTKLTQGCRERLRLSPCTVGYAKVSRMRSHKCPEHNHCQGRLTTTYPRPELGQQARSMRVSHPPNPLEIRIWSWIRDEAFYLRSNPNMVWHRYNRNPALGVRPHGKPVWWEDETCNYFNFKTLYAVKKPTRKVTHGIKITVRVCIIIIVWWVRGYVCIFWSRHVYRGMVRMEDWL